MRKPIAAERSQYFHFGAPTCQGKYSREYNGKNLKETKTRRSTHKTIDREESSSITEQHRCIHVTKLISTVRGRRVYVYVSRCSFKSTYIILHGII